MSDGTGHRFGHAFTLALFAMIVLAVVFLVWLGTACYRSIVYAQESDSSSRIVLSLVASDVAANDAADAVSLGQGPEGTMLVISEDADGVAFETRLYLYDGSLVEEYVSADTAIDPSEATRLADESEFELCWASPHLLCVSTSGGTEYLYVRSSVHNSAQNSGETL